MTKAVVVREVLRPCADTTCALERFGVSTALEAQGRTGLMAPYMRPIYPGAKISGPAITVSLPPGDNLMIHVAVNMSAGDSPGGGAHFRMHRRVFRRVAGNIVARARCSRPDYRSRVPGYSDAE